MLQRNEKCLAYEAELEDLRAKVECCKELKTKVALLEKAVAYSEFLSSEAPTVKILEPKSFNRVRDAKEVEKFLWNIERYLRVLKIEDEEKVNTASLYFTEDAMLW